MKLLHVISGMDPKLGGVSQAVRTMIAGLSAQGIDNEVASLDAPGVSWSQPDPFPIQALGPAKTPWGYGAALVPWLVANLHRFDAVLLHGLWLYHGYGLRKALRLMQAQQAGQPTRKVPKVFVMPHGMLDPYFQRAAGRKLKAWRNWAYWQVIEKSVVNEASGLLFTCETERQLAHEPFSPYRPQREIVIGLGVEEPPVYTAAMREAFLAKCPALENRPYLLFLSRIHEKKGVDLLVQAYAQLKQDLGAAAAQPLGLPALVLAGPGLDTAYGQRMQQFAIELVGAENVFMPGMLSGDAKWGAFYGCEAFVLPSHQENFGIAVVEALACAKPVLVSNQVNIWQEISGAAGGLIADDTLAGTQQLLARWAATPAAEKQAYGQRARQLYESSFAVVPATNKLLAALA
jgi:glycosyltransferase involved in cell wall biosynthesis